MWEMWEGIELGLISLLRFSMLKYMVWGGGKTLPFLSLFEGDKCMFMHLFECVKAVLYLVGGGKLIDLPV